MTMMSEGAEIPARASESTLQRGYTPVAVDIDGSPLAMPMISEMHVGG
jgi:hypothetical protein